MNINHPRNREVIAFLMATYATNMRSWGEDHLPEPVFEQDVDLGRLRTHPDVGGPLHRASLEVPGVQHGYVMGYDVVASDQGIIIAVAMSMGFMAFRLGTPLPEGAPILPGGELSAEWVGVSPWNPDLKDCVRRALARLAGSGPDERVDR